MTEKWTKGEWFVDGNHIRAKSATIGAYRVVNGERVEQPAVLSVADVFQSGAEYIGKEEMEANAALISAAPELAEALEKAANALQVSGDAATKRGDLGYAIVLKAHAKEARAALRKARGMR